MSNIKLGPCNNILYNVALDILNEVTGEKWGFVQAKVKISYITCKNIGAKFAIKTGRGSKKIDHYITTKTTSQDWENSLRFELHRALADYLKTKNIDKTIIDRTMPRLKQFIYNGVSIDECNIDLTNCREISRYKETFVRSKNDWIREETRNDNLPKILSREDFL